MTNSSSFCGGFRVGFRLEQWCYSRGRGNHRHAELIIAVRSAVSEACHVCEIDSSNAGIHGRGGMVRLRTKRFDFTLGRTRLIDPHLRASASLRVGGGDLNAHDGYVRHPGEIWALQANHNGERQWRTIGPTFS